MDKETEHILEVAAGTAVGAGVGGVLGFLIRDLMKAGLPAKFAAAVARLKLMDTNVSILLTGPVYIGGGLEVNGYEYHDVGFGLPGGTRLPDDVIVNLARHEPTSFTIANFVKLADDAVDVYLDNAKKLTLPFHGAATELTLYPAYAYFKISDV